MKKRVCDSLGTLLFMFQEYKAKEKKMVELQAKVDAYDKNIDQTLNERIKDVTERVREETRKATGGTPFVQSCGVRIINSHCIDKKYM